MQVPAGECKVPWCVCLSKVHCGVNPVKIMHWKLCSMPTTMKKKSCAELHTHHKMVRTQLRRAAAFKYVPHRSHDVKLQRQTAATFHYLMNVHLLYISVYKCICITFSITITFSTLSYSQVRALKVCFE